MKRPSSDSDHELVKDLREIIEARDRELAEQHASKKMEVLAEARALLDKARSQQKERNAYLPRQLLRKIDEAREREQEAVGRKPADNGQ